MPAKVPVIFFERRTILAVTFYVLVVVLIAVTVYFRNEATIYQQLDQRLAASAASIQYVLADTFHDRAVLKDSIMPAEDQQNIRLLTDLARQSGLSYLYTVIIQNVQVIITSSSASEKEIATGTEVRYFAPYDEAVNLLTKEFQKNTPVFVTHTDRWGTFRAGILQCEGPAGTPYIAVAEEDISTILANLRTELVLTFSYALLLLGATIPLYLVLSARLRSHTASLKQANELLMQEQKERSRLEQELMQAQKMEAIGTLAGGIAHDFNNILSAILGYAELAQEDCPPGSPVANDLDEVVQAANRARDLVKQILAFSRQAKTTMIALQPSAIIKESIKLLRSSLPATIDIRQDIDEDTGLILADPTQIHQIVMNLCTNAYHSMEETGGTLSLSLKKKILSQADLVDVPQVQPGNFVQLSIEDNGKGIAPGIRERIFDPYFTTKETGKGTGMGLAIVHGIVKSYGGFVTYNSQLGKGTVFDIALPSHKEDTAPETEPSEVIPVGTERILLIDDENVLVEMGQVMLEKLGYRVTVRTNSLEALTTFKNQPDAFDLVITDQTMPGITGIDLAREMLQIRPNLPIILCTGHSNLVSAENARSMGIREFAQKPLTRKDIAGIIRKVLDTGERNGA
jgi:signal transduction histidine kinase/ActR/RegA family two-component response regulator